MKKTRRTIKIFDDMVKGNSYLVLSSLLLLALFVSYAGDWFGFSSRLDNAALFNRFYAWFGGFSFDMFIIIVIPLLGAVFELIYGERLVKNRDKSIIYMGFLEIIYIVLLYPKVMAGNVAFSLPSLFSLGIYFQIDMLAYTVLLITSFVWFYVMVYAHEYMRRQTHGTRFFFFVAVTYSAVLGAIVSGDLLTMFIFFEIMTVASYMLVIHNQTDESYKAGFNYLFMGLIGGFLILAALLLIYFHVGDLRFASAIEALQDKGDLKYWIMGLLVFGFGIKAGMAPVHVWLPRAHPVAPVPASALLSGILIKIGAYGILRVAISYYFPAPDAGVIDVTLWDVAGRIGGIIIWTGIATMFMGAVLAAGQKNIKRLLAYSSVSQMGYILVGIGAALYLGYEGATGYAGAIYHIFNHALFKSLLFMVAGVVYYHTHEIDMYKLGGIARKLPFTTLVFIIAVFGIIGMPGFNGYLSKTIIHHGLSEVVRINPVFIVADIFFIITSVLTVTYFLKMFYYVFLRKATRAYKDLVFDFSSLDLALGSLAVLIVGVGLFPHFVTSNLIIPQLEVTAYDIHHIESHISSMNYFAISDVLMSFAIIAGGSLFFFIARELRLFDIKLPRWLSIEYVFLMPSYLLMKNLCTLLYGDKCPIDLKDFAKLSEKDVEKIGFVDRLTITANVINRRYEQSIIRRDTLIYAFFLTLTLIFLMVT